MTKRIATGVSFVIFLFVIWLVFIAEKTWPDETVFNTLSPYRSEGGTFLMRLITFLGNDAFLIPANLLLILFFIIAKRHKDALVVTVVALSSLGLMFLLKNSFQRIRPVAPMVDGISNYSFPSGHALMSLAFYGLLIIYAARHIQNRILRQSIYLLLGFLILLISFSRIYLRVHYTTDVIAGLSIGVCWLIFCLWAMQKITEGRNNGNGDITSDDDQGL
jgi:membrane-associated phospholipid phosphatase